MVQRNNFIFLIKWKDCDERENTWELYSNLRDNEILHKFLITNKLKRLFP